MLCISLDYSLWFQRNLELYSIDFGFFVLFYLHNFYLKILLVDYLHYYFSVAAVALAVVALVAVDLAAVALAAVALAAVALSAVALSAVGSVEMLSFQNL
jgi:hypothetical protein